MVSGLFHSYCARNLKFSWKNASLSLVNFTLDKYEREYGLTPQIGEGRNAFSYKERNITEYKSALETNELSSLDKGC